MFLYPYLELTHHPLNSDLSLLASAGTLDDVVPTVFKILDIPLPTELKGESLI